MMVYITRDKIIRSCKITKSHVFGFDLLSEDFIQVKLKDCIKVNKNFINSIMNERVRLVLSLSFSETNLEASKTMQIRERAFYRVKNRNLYNN